MDSLKFIIMINFSMTVRAMPMDMNMNMHGSDSNSINLTRPDIIDGTRKSLHWIATLFFLFLLPSITASFIYASKNRSATMLHFISTLYSTLEITTMSFADNDGVENVTSRATGWVLFLIIWATLFADIISSCANSIMNSNNKNLKLVVSFLGNKYLLLLNKVLASMVIILGWLRVCLAPVAMFGFCRNKHTGQCIAHGIMGSSFILYGFIYTLVLQIRWLRNSTASYSQDYIDSWVMCLYGIVNTFTEHRWGKEEWLMHDYQHTAMGILWWTGGILGIYLSRKNRRTFIPSLLIIFTGWAMTQHAQHLAISTNVHYFFGVILMTGGALRILEISVLLGDFRSDTKILSFQYLPPFCLIAAGVLFMSANEEQLILVLRLNAEHSSYIMVILSGAFLLHFWMIVCLDLYVYLMEKNDTDILGKYSETWNNGLQSNIVYEMSTNEESEHINDSNSFEI